MRVVLHGRRSPGRLDPVSGLLAALRRLGSPVLHLDDAVDVASLRPVLQRFRPHLLVQLGASPAVSDEVRDMLHEHGVLALGWQVEARRAGHDEQEGRTGDGLDLLASTGVRAGDPHALHVPPGALTLPFAADRDLLHRHVPSPPGRPRDVLALGHATHHGPAHALAARLVEVLDAAAYGAGWPQSWQGSPDGAHLFQVLRHGRVHVHVTPGAGPWLSIAAGGVVAVPAGTAADEQLRGFTAGEVLRLGDPDEAVEQVGALLADPERLASVRAAARARLLAAHLYEHRWASLVGELERRATAPGADAGGGSDVLADVLARAGQDRTGRPRRVVVSGWYGAANTGDDLILEALARRVETDVPDAEVVVAARYPSAVLAAHGLEAFDRTDRRASEEEASRATAVLLGAGGLWEDYTFVRNGGVAGLVTDAVASVTGLAVLPLLAAVHRRPVHVVGVGAGPLADPGAQAVVRHVGALAESVTVRDARSRDQLLAIPGWQADVQVAPDVVYALDPGPLPPPRVARVGGRPLVAVNLRPWGEDEPAVTAALGALRDLARARDAVLVGLPLSPQDAARLAAVLPADGAEHVLLDPVGADLGQLVADLAECDVLVSMRLHGCLVAHRAGTPVVGLGYDPKVAAHFAELGRERFVVPVEDADAALLPLLEEALDSGLPPSAREAVRSLERRAGEALASLTRRLAAADPPQEPPASLPWLDDDVPGRLRLPCAPGDVLGGSALVPGRRPPVLASATSDGLALGFAGTQLRAGDTVTWSSVVPAAGGGSGRRVELRLAAPNLEDSARAGRLVWQVRVDGRVLVTEDVAGWKQEVSLWVGWGAAAGDVRLEVRVLALADCGGRGWRRASGLRLHAPVAHAWPEGGSLPRGRWTASCSSPGAAVLT